MKLLLGLGSGNELRRTASWGSRDAFTDGHMRHHADEGANGKSGKRVSATARAHAFRKFHPAYKTTVSPPAQGNQPQIADIAPLVPEKRRNSAPEALRWPPAPEPGPVSVVKQVQRLQQSSAARPSPGLEPHPRTGVPRSGVCLFSCIQCVFHIKPGVKHATHKLSTL